MNRSQNEFEGIALNRIQAHILADHDVPTCKIVVQLVILAELH